MSEAAYALIGAVVTGAISFFGVLLTIRAHQSQTLAQLVQQTDQVAVENSIKSAAAYEHFYNILLTHRVALLVNVSLGSELLMSLKSGNTSSDSDDATKYWAIEECQKFCTTRSPENSWPELLDPTLTDEYARLHPLIREQISTYNVYRQGIILENISNISNANYILSNPDATWEEKYTVINNFIKITYHGMLASLSRIQNMLHLISLVHNNANFRVLDHWDTYSKENFQFGRIEESTDNMLDSMQSRISKEDLEFTQVTPSQLENPNLNEKSSTKPRRFMWGLRRKDLITNSVSGNAIVLKGNLVEAANSLIVR